MVLWYMRSLKIRTFRCILDKISVTLIEKEGRRKWEEQKNFSLIWLLFKCLKSLNIKMFKNSKKE